MDFGNATELDGDRLKGLFQHHAWPYRHEGLRVRVRYSRGTDFSGTCLYSAQRIYVNLGRHLDYPYLLGAHIARAQSNRTHWWRETYRLVIANAYQLALFIFLHEFYHYLLKMAGRNLRRKESMCDRFAARELADHHGVRVLDAQRRAVARSRWDFQDLHAFVHQAPKVGTLGELFAAAPPRTIPVVIHGVRTGTRRARERSGR